MRPSADHQLCAQAGRTSPAALLPISTVQPASKAQYLDLITPIFQRLAFCTPVLHIKLALSSMPLRMLHDRRLYRIFADKDMYYLKCQRRSIVPAHYTKYDFIDAYILYSCNAISYSYKYTLRSGFIIFFMCINFCHVNIRFIIGQ